MSKYDPLHPTKQQQIESAGAMVDVYRDTIASLERYAEKHPESLQECAQSVKENKEILIILAEELKAAYALPD